MTLSWLALLGACTDPGDLSKPDDTPVDSTPVMDSDTAPPPDSEDTSSTDSGETGDSTPVVDSPSPDLDGDGFSTDDCNDGDDEVFPGAADESCDEVDQDCDGQDLCAAEDADYWFSMQGGHYAEALAFANLDGDGREDFIVKVSWDATDPRDFGLVYVVLGRDMVSGALATIGDTTITGEEGLTLEAFSTVVLGDVDADGLDDVAIGVNDGFGLFGGATLGAGGELSAASAAYISESLELPGYLWSAGDLDEDGVEELVAMGDDYRSLVFYASGDLAAGMAGAIVAPTWRLATSVTSVSNGDVDGDGISDVLVNIFGYSDVAVSAGCTYVVSGVVLVETSANIEDVSTLLYGEADFDSAGNAGIVPDDIDGDGLNDVVIGAAGIDSTERRDNAAGGVFGFFSSRFDGTSIPMSAADFVIEGNLGTAAFTGNFMTTAGDQDGDDVGDFWVDSESGVGLFSGASFSSGGTLVFEDASRLITGHSGEGIRPRYDSVGDMNADGILDLAIDGELDTAYIFVQ